MKITVNTVVAVILSLFTSALFAEEPVHTIGVTYGIGTASNSLSNSFKNDRGQSILVDDFSGSTEFSYNYQFAKNWAVDFNYLTADSNRASIIFDELFPNKFSMNEISLGMKGLLPMSEHNDFFVRLDLSSYNYKIKKDFVTLINKNGLGLVGGIGWQYHFDNGVQLNLSFNYHKLGSVNYYFSNYGVAYRF